MSRFLSTSSSPVQGASGVVLDNSNRPIPGFKLVVPAGSASFPSDMDDHTITVTQVHTDKIPIPPGEGMQPKFIISVGPPTVKFDPPAKLTYPNVDGLKPGEQTTFYSFDHDLGTYVSIGSGTVSEDGATVSSDPGFGLVKGGWHCAGPNNPTGGAQPPKVHFLSASQQYICKDNVFTLTAVGQPNPGTMTWSGGGSPGQKTDQSPRSSFTTTFNTVGQKSVSAEWKCQSGQFASDDTKICVVDPGITPTSLQTPTYTPVAITPTIDWGNMQPHANLDVDIDGYFDCSSQKWKAKVTIVESKYDIGSRLLPGVQSASVAAATQSNQCQMILDLKNLGGQNWYILAAVQAHENVHVQEWQNSLNPEFSKMKSAIEKIEVSPTCNMNASQAKSQIKSQMDYTKAINDARTKAGQIFAAIPDPNANTDAAEMAVVNPVILGIRAKATVLGWPQCPP